MPKLTKTETRDFISAMRKTTTQHIVAAIASISDQVKDKKGKGIIATVAKLMENKKFLNAWDLLSDLVLNSGGEPNEIHVGIDFWYNMTQALRMIFSLESHQLIGPLNKIRENINEAKAKLEAKHGWR